MIDFASDNVSGTTPEILAAIAEANAGASPSYGADPFSGRLTARFTELFETDDLAVFPVLTGTAANALALASAVPPWGAVYCHELAHIYKDECGAPEFLSGGARLVPLPGSQAKLAPDSLAKAIEGAGNVHRVQPAALSLSQASELGTLYRPEELSALTEIARKHGLVVHMDGARFANAVASLELAPAELTWRAGVEILSFGATKNGCLAAEAVVFFGKDAPARAERFAFLRKRSGHLLSKMRFLSAQLLAYLDEDRWLSQARHANAQAQALARGIASLKGVELLHPVEVNELFLVLPAQVRQALRGEGFRFYEKEGGADARLVTSWSTKPEEVTSFLSACARHLARVAA